MKILHISDTHFGKEDYFNRETLNEVLEEANSGEYDLLLHSGDVTQGGRAEYYKIAQKYFKQIDIPHLIVPGNHDKRSGGLSLFEDYIGPANGFDEIGEAVVVYVDSAVSDSDDGRVGMVKFEMLKEALRKFNDKKIKIVLLHHHVLPVPKAGRERNILSNAGDLLDLFLKEDVDLVVSGHRHFPNVHSVENMVFVNAGTVSARKTRYGDVNSYNVLDVGEEDIRVETRRVDGSVKSKVFSRKERRIFYEFGERIFRIVHMSNTFISNSNKFRYTHFMNAVDSINTMDADVLVHCGGVVEEGISRDYELAKNYMNRIKVTKLYTPAGRDINYLGYKLFSDHFGGIDQSFSNEEIFLQGISSSQYDSPIGVVGETERNALFEKLRRHEDSFKCVFLHHNIVPIPHSREKGLLEDSGDLLRGLVDEEVDLVLTGTSSHPFAAKIGDSIVVNANSLSSVYQRSLYGNSFNVIDIYENVIVVSEVNSLWGTKRILGIWDRKGGSQ
ncbi:MAG: metallophosphoesterase family protein [Candidatus Saliniplasma sp.]